MELIPIQPPRALVERFRRLSAPATPDAAGEEALAQARTLFAETFAEEPENVAFAPGYVPLLAEHTRYFGGFGLMLRLPWGAAAAVRPAARPRMTALGVTLPRARRLAAMLFDATGSHWELAIVSMLEHQDEEAVLAAIVAAVLRATGYDAPEAARIRLETEAVEAASERPVGPAFALAAAAGEPLVLVDATTLEHLALERPEGLCFGLLSVPGAERLAPHQDWERRALVEEALGHLRARGVAHLPALRRLEHRDAEAALRALPQALAPFVRYLVSEDRRVPRIVAALRRADGQKLGAMLTMSLASRRDDEGLAVPLAETVADAVPTVDGIYGARPVGSGAAVLVVGRHFLLPEFLEALAAETAATPLVLP